VGDVIGFIYSNGKWKQTVRIGEPQRAAVNGARHRGDVPMTSPKMIDNLFNSFTCHAVAGVL
jgi:hypothetical protein